MPSISSVVIDGFKRLPRRSDEVWQGGLVRARTWVEEPDGRVRRPWAAVWVSLATGLVNVDLATADAVSDASLALQVLADLGLKFARCRPPASRWPTAPWVLRSSPRWGIPSSR
jgi:hypothetical protein